MYMFPYFKALAGMYLPEVSEGQGMVEYGLILVLVSIAAFAALQLLGGTISGVFNTINGDL